MYHPIQAHMCQHKCIIFSSTEDKRWLKYSNDLQLTYLSQIVNATVYWKNYVDEQWVNKDN